jgi:hypothetical protein
MEFATRRVEGFFLGTLKNRGLKMKSLVRATFLAAAGILAVSVSAHAAGSAPGNDTQLFKPRTTTDQMLLAQRSENPGGGMFRNENPGGGMYKKKKKKKKHS